MAAIKKAIFAISLALLIAVAGCTQADSDDMGAKEETVVETPATQAEVSTPQAQAETPAEAAEHAVEFSHNYFSPSKLNIGVGDTVIFRNLVTMSHPLVSQEAGLDTGEFTGGERSFAFDKEGTFTITNTAHNTKITIVVGKGGEAAESMGLVEEAEGKGAASGEAAEEYSEYDY